jgi:hypothetical protein
MADAKLDLFQVHKDEYKAQARPTLVQTSPAVYLAFSGKGAPGGAEFQAGIDALFGMSFTVKAARKAAGLEDYAIGKLEARWPGFERRLIHTLPDKEGWLWQLMVRTPESVTDEDLEEARRAIEMRARQAATDRVERIRLNEGLCVQALHVGPYEAEGATLDRMRAFAAGEGLRAAGEHHEVYLSDPRRVEPARLKTILRIPVLKDR